MGSMQVKGLGGKRYVLVCVDDYSRYTWVKFIKIKLRHSLLAKLFVFNCKERKIWTLYVYTMTMARSLKTVSLLNSAWWREYIMNFLLQLLPNRMVWWNERIAFCMRWLDNASCLCCTLSFLGWRSQYNMSHSQPNLVVSRHWLHNW